MDTIRTIKDFHKYFTDEWVCFWFFVSLRWATGFVCRKCGHTACKKVGGRWTLRCLNCNDQVSVKVGTVMQHSKLPLKKWLNAALLISKNDGLPATQLKNHIDVCYETAYTLGQRIRHAMAERELVSALEQPSSVAVAHMEDVTQLSRAMGWVAVAFADEKDDYNGRTEEHQNKSDAEAVAPNRPRARLHMQVIRGAAAETDECADITSFVERHTGDDKTVPPTIIDPEMHGGAPIQRACTAVKSWLARVFRRMVGRHLKRYLWEYSYRFNRQREKRGSVFAALVGDIARSTPLPYRDFLAGRA